mmetsp:Transcript_12753/g.30522  ORF Transcript_12753/g.30522 Transcript_12753/m.30522 type:complete len:236 (-) Transcript_12753:83-790(-)
MPRGNQAQDFDAISLDPRGMHHMQSHRFPKQWAQNSYNYLQAARRQCRNAFVLRSAIGDDCRAMDKKRANQSSAVNYALRERVAETENLYRSLRSSVVATSRELQELALAREQLLRTVHDNKARKRVTEECLMNRTQRPHREMLRDTAEVMLEHELTKLHETINSQRMSIRDIEARMAKLQKLKKSLEADMLDKRQALDVDAYTLNMHAPGAKRSHSARHHRKRPAYDHTPTTPR